MIINLRPKELFMADDEQVKSFNDMAYSSTVQTALALAYTELAQQSPTAEELSGVNRFVRIFLNLGQKVDPPVATPFKSIATALPAREQPPASKK